MDWRGQIAAANAAAILLSGGISVVRAQEPAPPPAAKAQFDSGTAALKRNDAPRAVEAYRKAITIDPAYYDAHEAYMKATRRVYEKADTTWDFDDTLKMRRRGVADSLANAELTREYTQWAAHKRKVAAYQWALGDLKGESPEAEPYYKKAVELDPKLARAYEWLSLIAEFRGDDAASAEYMRKAMEADTTNAGYAFDYAWKFRDGDPAKYRATALDVVRRFPADQKSAQILYWLGNDAASDSAKIAIYEQARRDFPPDKFGWSADAMDGLYDVYIRVVPDKALTLAKDMLNAASKADEQRDWAPRVLEAQNLILARSLAGERKYAAASAVLGVTQLSKYSGNQEMFALLRAELADSAGNTKAAYDSVLVRFAKTPSDSVQAAMGRYATKLHKSATQVDSAVWAIRDTAARPATPFRLASYGGPTDSIALADYKGKVVLLTFWFPGCGPCRGEFPHFQKVANSLKGRSFAYVGINVVPEQDAYVASFLKGTQYSFTPLHGNDKFAKAAYHVRGEPTNFLIDGNGRIVFKDFRADDAEGERMLTLMIESMLAHTPGAAPTQTGR
jgi:thiol-disulfide isomerase/thioredoxin/Tfp pilus assembly protein PilF